MYKATLDKEFYILGVIHSDDFITEYEDVINQCDSLLMEADLNQIRMEDLFDCCDIPLKYRVSGKTLNTIGEYLDLKTVKYVTLESIMLSIYVSMIIDKPNIEEFDEKTLWNRFEVKDELETQNQHISRTKEATKHILYMFRDLIDNKLSGLEMHLETLKPVAAEIREMSMDLKNNPLQEIDLPFKLNNDIMVNKIHSYDKGVKTLVVTGVAHTKGILEGLETLGYSVEKL